MNQATIVVPPSIRQFVGGETHITVEARTVREALEAFAARSNDLRDHLFDSGGGLRRFIRVIVNGKLATIQNGQDEHIAQGAEVTIFFALAGG